MALKIRIIDGDKIIDRDMNEEELAIHIASEAQLKTQVETAAVKDAARQAVLDKLGLTADEAAALLGQFGNTYCVGRLRNNTR